MRATFLVAGVELRRRLRNRSALFTAFIGPLALAVVFGVLLKGTSSFTLKIGVVDLDRSDVSTPFVTGLRQITGGPIRIVDVADRSVALAQVDDGDLDAAIVIPQGFAGAVTTGAAANLEVLRDPRGQVSGDVAQSIAARFASSLSARSLAVATAMSLGGRMPTAAELDAMPDTAATAVVTVAPGGREATAAPFYGASMSILFLFFTVSFAARSLISDRANGLVARMAAASATTPSIVAGKVLAVSTLGLAGFVTVWGATSLLFGNSWGDPLAVAVVMVATVAAVAAVASTVCGLARTAEQADGYTSAVTFALALLGGNFLGPGQAPPALKRVAGLTPNGQALDAFTRLAADGVGLGGVWHQVAALGGVAVAFALVSHVLLRRSIR